MKIQLSNIALEETRIGEVVGGLYREPRENLQAFLFGKREHKQDYFEKS